MKITVEVSSKSQARLIETMAKKLCHGSKKSVQWTDLSPVKLIQLLIGEVDELWSAIEYPKFGPAEGDPWKEAADIANYAAMVADQASRQKGRIMNTCENCKFWVRNPKSTQQKDWGVCTFTLPPQLKRIIRPPSRCHKNNVCSLFSISDDASLCVRHGCTNTTQYGFTVCKKHKDYFAKEEEYKHIYHGKTKRFLKQG